MTTGLDDSKSHGLFERALAVMPGGVNSPVRAMRSIGRDPLFIDRGQGCEITDVDGNSFTDYVCSWGPLILGPAHTAVVEAVQAQLEKGSTYGSHTVPVLNLPPQEGAHRILHIHKNVPGVLSKINTQLSKHKINILGQSLKTNEAIGYVVLDVDKSLSKNAMELLKKVEHTIKVRILY
jgi:4-aminobutyrate aminotransferase-like enzyme